LNGLKRLNGLNFSKAPPLDISFTLEYAEQNPFRRRALGLYHPAGNGFKISHMRDTGLFGDMKMIGEYYKPDLILIPIGGGQFVMNSTDAAYATRNYLKPNICSHSTTPPVPF
jgi:L-ascorbate metabolism protein UlaG (beta-lactamase superfamily)